MRVQHIASAGIVYHHNRLVASGPEQLKFLKILPPNSNLLIHSGKHFVRFNPGNQLDYTGKRGHRGKMLPRGYQNVSSVEVIPIDTSEED